MFSVRIVMLMEIAVKKYQALKKQEALLKKEVTS
jgi:hypothetical protein